MTNNSGPSTMQELRSTPSSTTHQKTREEMLTVGKSSNALRTIEWARKVLKKGMYMPEGKEVTNLRLALVLLQLACTDKLKKPISDGLKAVVLLLVEVENKSTAELIAAVVGNTLTTLVQNISTHSNEPTVEDLMTDSESATSAGLK
jgi:hypothetical protein